MATEALRIAPRALNGVTPEAPAPQIPELPFHLRRRTLKKILFEEGRVPENLWNGRGDAVEVRTQGIIASQTMIVESVTMNAQYAEGSDFRVKFVKGFSVKKDILVEIKSSTLGKRMRKQEIRDTILTEENNGQLMGPWTKKMAMTEWNNLSHDEMEAAISRCLTDNRVILINGGEEDFREKTPLEILNESFFPQLERIWLKDRQKDVVPQLVQVFPEPEQNPIPLGQIQLFPEAA